MTILERLSFRRERKRLDALAVKSAEYMVDRLEKRVDVLLTRANVVRGSDGNRQHP